MKSVVRAFLFNSKGEILMTRHKKDAPWTLPWWHVEQQESMQDAVAREIHEEFGIQARFFTIDENEILHHKWKRLEHNVLPIASYNLKYHDIHWNDKSRMENIFLMETSSDVNHIQVEEIEEYAWFDPEEILVMKPNIDTWDFYIEMLQKIIGVDDNLEI